MHLLIRLLLLCCLLWPATSYASPKRVLYVEGGNLEVYTKVLSATLKGLSSLDLLQLAPETWSDATTSAQIWSILAAKTKEKELSFLADGFYSASWDSNKRQEIARTIQNRLDERKDVDLIIAMGTWAGQDMARLTTNVPVLVCNVTDAVKAGIVHSVVDSGKDNVTAMVEPELYKQEVDFFHELFGFETLGVTYEDTPTSRTMIALNDIQEACETLGVTLVPCHGWFHTQDTMAQATQHQECNRTFVEKGVDAVYIAYTLQGLGLSEQDILEPLISANIPTFTQVMGNEVEGGVLLGRADTSFFEGMFYAKHIKEIFAGASPRSLNQIFSRPTRFALNIDTAARIGWDPPLSFLLPIDKFYQ